jgi:dihydroflavonol-4-reductase
MKIFITGATGFVGTVLIPKLVALHGSQAITAFVLPGDPLPVTWRDSGVRIISGDICDPVGVAAASHGHSHIIHLAGLISYWKKDLPRLLAVNRDGVANVVDATLANKVERLVHISSVGAIGFRPDGQPADEETPFNWPRNLVYMTSKLAGQQVIETAVRDRGLPAVIINPASIMGPGDLNSVTPHNQLYHTIYSKTLFGSFAGGLAVVDVRDLAELIIKALNGGVIGEKYLAVGANLSYRQVIETIARHAKRPAYPWRLPAPLFMIAGGAMEGISLLTGRRPLLTYGYGRLSGLCGYYDSTRSQRVFGQHYTDFEDTIRDTCRFYEKTFHGKQSEQEES